MTVEELIAELQNYDGDRKIFAADQGGWLYDFIVLDAEVLAIEPLWDTKQENG